MLTDTKLRTLKPRSVIYRVADAKGLAIEIRPSGARIWRYRFRYAGKASMATFGEYPLITLGEARERAREARKTLAAGVSPVTAERVRRKALAESVSNTFSSVALEYLGQRVKTLSPGAAIRERRLLERDLFPSIGRVPISEVTAAALLAALRKIQSRGAIETAHRARALTSQVFRYAVQIGKTESNPAINLVGGAALVATKTEHFASITDPAQVGPLLRAIHAYRGRPETAAALRLAPLVFVRPGELRAMQWADVDFEAEEWRFTASKTGTPHIVPLSTQALVIMRELHALTGHQKFVFPSIRTPNRPMSENTLNAALRALGISGDHFTSHGWRACARTILDEVLGFPPHVIEHQLAHAVRDPLGRAYNRAFHLSERRKMMQQWANFLDGLRNGASVMPFKRKVS
ncbi:MAG: integrase arm-type DNA-binding domain-containing protein [Rhodanobacter sp.]|jgi:integrase|nr:integrase arm-type DNA-binding domain-containing protein [Rhodanobacter sp.]